MTLNQRFSTNVLQAYQENSKTKILDLLSYFEMLTDKNITKNSKQEIIESIKLLYRNPNELIIDFTANTPEKLQYLNS